MATYHIKELKELGICVPNKTDPCLFKRAPEHEAETVGFG